MRLHAAARPIVLSTVALCMALAPLLASLTHAQSCGTNQKYCPAAGQCISTQDLCLLEPTPGGVSYIPASTTSNMGAFLTYINNGIWYWAFGVAIGIAVLNGTVAGFQIMMGGPNVEKGKERFMWATIGLLLLLLSGTILAFINPQGFTSA